MKEKTEIIITFDNEKQMLTLDVKGETSIHQIIGILASAQWQVMSNSFKPKK